MDKFIEFLEQETKNARKNLEFATSDEQRILFTVAIRLTEGYLEKARQINSEVI